MVARVKMQIDGSLGNPAVERWSTAVHFATEPLPAPPATQERLALWAGLAAEGIVDQIAGDGPLSDLLSTVGTVDSLTLYAYGSTGSAYSSATALIQESGNGTLKQAFQVSTVFSLYGESLGQSARGRSYWPGLGMTVGTNGKVAAGAYANDFALLINNVELASGDLLADLVVYSPSLDQLTPVSVVKWGDVPDTQRRRRDNLVEAYSLAPV